MEPNMPNNQYLNESDMQKIVKNEIKNMVGPIAIVMEYITFHSDVDWGTALRIYKNKTQESIMTKQEYENYVQSVNQFFETEGVNCLSPVCDYDTPVESYFSHRDCECCKRSLAGDRYDCDAFRPETNEIIQFSVCPDCVYFAEYGQLDDMTMMDIQE